MGRPYVVGGGGVGSGGVGSRIAHHAGMADEEEHEEGYW